jgi:PKD repeat protein
MLIRSILFCFLSLQVILKSQAQCPIAATCTPGNAPASAYPFGMGIYEVTVGTGANGFSNPTSLGITDGYQDYSCTKKATVLEGAATAIAVTTNPNVNENVRVWIDLNNDGTFNATTELVFSSNIAKTHSGTFIVPVSGSVVKNAVLRMRVSADNFTSPIPTPCSTPAYSQVEDYGITVLPNTNKPAVDFAVNKTVTCSPTVQFTAQVQNGATSYLWSFGDGTTSTLQNPAHTYGAIGSYHVKLKACNANGCDSLTKNNFVIYHNYVPGPASCTPATTSYCCGYGITKVTLQAMVNSSQNGSVGYEDFTCPQFVMVEEGLSYPIAIETGSTSNQDTWIYLDYNNDGSFSSNELILTRLNAKNPTGNILIGPAPVRNTPLRMRIISDAVGTATGPCANRTSGQAEDYTIVITPNTHMPTPSYTTNFTSVCDTIIQFTDTTPYAPISWLWDFGDGSPKSSLRNPVHTFATNRAYTIKLKVCNSLGCDSTSRVNALTFRRPCLPYCAPPAIGFGGHWLTNVTFNTIYNNSAYGQGGYENFTNLSTTIIPQNTYVLTTTTSQNISYRKHMAWIDYNQDGDFADIGEQVASDSLAPVISSPVTIPLTAKAGVTRLRVSTGFIGSPLNSCGRSGSNYEIEDYSIIIPASSQPPIVNFSKVHSLCSFSFNFADSSGQTPTSWLWDFGDPNSGVNNTSTLQNPGHTFSAAGTYTIKLTACNTFGCTTRIKNAFVTATSNVGPRGIACKPQKANPQSYGDGITSVILNTLTNVTGINDGYKDYSCTKRTMLVAGNSYPMTVVTSIYEVVRGWIDFNDNGDFDPVTELVFSAANGIQTHSATINLPSSAVLNKPLRLRIASGLVNNPAPTPCVAKYGGQVEDYAVTITGTTGIPEQLTAGQVNIYPNPNTGTFFLEIPTVFKGNLQFEVLTLLGQKVTKRTLEAGTSTFSLNLNYLPKGIYLLKIFNAETSAIKKIVIE